MSHSAVHPSIQFNVFNCCIGFPIQCGKWSASSTRACWLERLMQDNEKTSIGTFMKWYYTHLSFPRGCYHVPTHHHVLFNDYRIEPVCWCYFTENGSVIVSHTWTMTVHSGVNYMPPSSNSKEDTPLSCLPSPVKVFLCNFSTSVLTHIKKKWNPKCEIHSASVPERGINLYLSLACVIYQLSFRLLWQKFTLAPHSHRATRRCPCVATSTLLLLCLMS